PDEPIRSLEAAAKVIRRQAGDQLDRKTEELLRRIKGAMTLEAADAGGEAFRAWAEAEGRLLGPPERRRAPATRGGARARGGSLGRSEDRSQARLTFSSSLALENRGDRLDLVARINRQPRADRVAAVERALAGEHLRRHQIPQHRHLHEFFLLLQNIALDRQR